MGEKIQTRVLVIVAVILLCIFGVVGLPKNVQELRANIADRIHLGLDLKGGSHFVLRVHVDDAVKITSDQDLERLKDELKGRNIPYSDAVKTDDTHIGIKGVPQNKAADVQSVVSDHHGRISVSSDEGRGTTFRIELPLRQTQRPAPSAEAPPESKTTPSALAAASD
jgi:preprotein translocase subunit SecD